MSKPGVPHDRGAVGISCTTQAATTIVVEIRRPNDRQAQAVAGISASRHASQRHRCSPRWVPLTVSASGLPKKRSGSS